jgi:hypothetical protein
MIDALQEWLNVAGSDSLSKISMKLFVYLDHRIPCFGAQAAALGRMILSDQNLQKVIHECAHHRITRIVGFANTSPPVKVDWFASFISWRSTCERFAPDGSPGATP